jgi:alpha-tubulin suppressor-like RCC1 family protein
LEHSLALLNSGRVVCWGDNAGGKCTVPLEAQEGNATAIAAGGSHSLALLKSGKVVAWGDDRSGQLTIPAAVQSGKAVSIAAGGLYSAAVLDTGELHVWGGDGNGSDVPAEATTGVARVSIGTDNKGNSHFLVVKGGAYGKPQGTYSKNPTCMDLAPSHCAHDAGAV